MIPGRTVAVNLKYDKFDVYVGRAGRGYDGFFGNPVRIGAECLECGVVHESGGDTLPCFEIYFKRRLRSDPEFKRRVLGLRGKRLGCFCVPRPCHSEIMARWIDNQPLAQEAP